MAAVWRDLFQKALRNYLAYSLISSDNELVLGFDEKYCFSRWIHILKHFLDNAASWFLSASGWSGRLCLVGPEDWSGVWGADRRSGQTLWLRTDPSGGWWRKCKHLHTNKTCFLKNICGEACQCLTLICVLEPGSNTDTIWPLRPLKIVCLGSKMSWISSVLSYVTQLNFPSSFRSTGSPPKMPPTSSQCIPPPSTGWKTWFAWETSMKLVSSATCSSDTEKKLYMWVLLQRCSCAAFPFPYLAQSHGRAAESSLPWTGSQFLTIIATLYNYNYITITTWLKLCVFGLWPEVVFDILEIVISTRNQGVTEQAQTEAMLKYEKPNSAH